MGEVVIDVLEKELSNFKLNLLLDGLIVYKTNSELSRIKQLRFINNSFLLLKMIKVKDADQALNEIVSWALTRPISTHLISNFLPTGRHSFRVMFWKENQSISADSRILVELEKKFRNDQLFVNRTNPTIEFSFLTRNEGYGLFGLRLTRHKDYKKILHKGELRPEIANLMCLLSEPNPKDVFLDSFAGYGAIPIERASFPYAKIYAGDINGQLVNELAKKSIKYGKRFRVIKLDATRLTEFKDELIDKIVTDPPWGLYDENVILENLYIGFLKEFERILSPQGVIVLLTAAKGCVEECLTKIPMLNLVRKYNILVSGKKASIYKLVH